MALTPLHKVGVQFLELPRRELTARPSFKRSVPPKLSQARYAHGRALEIPSRYGQRSGVPSHRCPSHDIAGMCSIPSVSACVVLPSFVRQFGHLVGAIFVARVVSGRPHGSVGSVLVPTYSSPRALIAPYVLRQSLRLGLCCFVAVSPSVFLEHGYGNVSYSTGLHNIAIASHALGIQSCRLQGLLAKAQWERNR